MSFKSSGVYREWAEQQFSALNAETILDTRGMSYVCFQLRGTFVGSLVAEGSNDRQTWVASSIINSNGVGIQADAVLVTGPGIYIVPAGCAYLKLRCSAWTSGTLIVNPIAENGGFPNKNSQLAQIASNQTIGTNAVAAANGLTTVSKLAQAAATTNATVAKAGAGRLYKVTGLNVSAAVKWLKIYNKSTTPVPGTDVPVFQWALPVGMYNYDFGDIGYYCSTGIGFAITGAAPDLDTTVLALGDILNQNVFYA